MKSLLLILTLSIPLYAADIDLIPSDFKVYGYSMKEIQSKTINEDGPYYYEKLEDKLAYSDTFPNETELIMLYYGYVFFNEYKPWITLDVENKAIDANTKGEYGMAKYYADSILATCPVSLTANMEKSYASYRQKDSLQGRYYQKVFRALKDIALKSGDGLSYETAYKVLNPKDINIIYEHRRIAITGRKTKEIDGRYYEIGKYVKKGKKRKIYFETTLPETIGRKSVIKKDKD